MQNYPSLTELEFSEACQILEQCCHGKLDGSDWSYVNWVDGELIIRQERTKEASPSGNDDEKVEWQGSEIEELDEEVIDRDYDSSAASLLIDFSVTLSPSYQVPVLWFRLNSTVPTSVNQLEAVYKSIVSPDAQEIIRNVGNIGGISIAHHPRSDLPAFFIHPCQTSEVLASIHTGKDTSPIQYLMLWFGITGSAVGLSVPSSIASIFV